MSREDGARFSPQPTKNKSCCSVNGCYSKAYKDLTVRFHTFPKPVSDFIHIPNKSGGHERVCRRDIWAQRLMIDKAITENTRVCSLHFKRTDYILPDAPTQKRYLKRDAIPSCNLPLPGSDSFPGSAMSNDPNEDTMDKCEMNDGMVYIKQESNAPSYENQSDDNYGDDGSILNRATIKEELEEPEITLETYAESYKDKTDGRYVDDKSVIGGTAIKDEPQETGIKLEPLDEGIDELYIYENQEEHHREKRTGSKSIMLESDDIDIKFEPVDPPDLDINSHFQRLWDPSLPVRGKVAQKTKNFHDAATQTDEQLSGPKFIDIIKSNKDLNILTGIPNFSVLNTIIDVVKVVSPRLTKVKGLKLSITDRIIMTFMKLKQDLTYEAISAFFKCKSKRSCKRIILQTLDTLSCGLKFAIRWPEMNKDSRNLPNYSYDLSSIRCIINRIEIAVRKSKEPFRRATTFSSYKKYYSAKFITAITPSGLICFLSRAYGGRTSHRTLFQKSNIIQYLHGNDAVMIFKDFPIDDICQQHNIKLVKSLYSQNIEHGQNPTNYRLRLNVNRRIRRFRIFRRKLTTTLLLKIEQILTILCAIENLTSLTSDITSSKHS